MSSGRSIGKEVVVESYPEIPIIAGAPQVKVPRGRPLPTPNPLIITNYVNGLIYQWYHNNQLLNMAIGREYSFNPVNLVNAGRYYVTVSTPYARCSRTSADLELIVETDIRIPKSITPNGDDKYDFFEIENLDLYTPAELIIVNRWGNEVFRATNYCCNINCRDKCFTGANLQDGTYFYTLIFTEQNGVQTRKTGYFTLKH